MKILLLWLIAIVVPAIAADSPHERRSSVEREREIIYSYHWDPECEKQGFDLAAWDPFLKETFGSGLACFRRLGTRTSLSHEVRLRTALTSRKTPLKIGCINALYSQGISPEVKEGPALLLTSFYNDLGRREREEIARVVFHELIHVIGYKHGEGVDYAYACDGCCFPSAKLRENDGTRAELCKVCAGDYQSTDPQYQAAILRNFRTTTSGMSALFYSSLHLLPKAEDRTALFLITAEEALQHPDSHALALAFHRYAMKTFSPAPKLVEKYAPHLIAPEERHSKLSAEDTDSLTRAYVATLSDNWYEATAEISGLSWRNDPGLNNLLRPDVASEVGYAQQYTRTVLLLALAGMTRESDALSDEVDAYNKKANTTVLAYVRLSAERNALIAKKTAFTKRQSELLGLVLRYGIDPKHPGNYVGY